MNESESGHTQAKDARGLENKVKGVNKVMR